MSKCYRVFYFQQEQAEEGKESADPQNPPAEVNDERFAEIESLVAAFDCPEDETGSSQPKSVEVGKVDTEVKEDVSAENSTKTRDSLSLTQPQGKVHKKRGRKSKEEKARLAKLAIEDEEARTRRPRTEKADACKTEKPFEEAKLEKEEENKRVIDTDTGSGSETTEGKVQKARRTGGPPTKKETHRNDPASAAALTEAEMFKEVPPVVGECGRDEEGEF